LKALERLQKKGAKPGLYVYTNPGNAEGHAEAQYEDSGTPAVIEVKVQKSWLRPDPEYGPFDEFPAFAFIVSRSLPPNSFGVITTWESDGWIGG